MPGGANDDGELPPPPPPPSAAPHLHPRPAPANKVISGMWVNSHIVCFSGYTQVVATISKAVSSNINH